MTSSPVSSDRGEEASLRLLPPIRRARGYRLYDLRGGRYLDLFLGGGRALLGHRSDRVLLELKNLISRGLAADFPSVMEHRFAKALSFLLPGYPVVRIFSSEERVLGALAALAPVADRRAEGSPPLIGDPLLSGAAGSPALRWRPFLPPDAEFGPLVVPLLPFPGSFAPVAVCMRADADGGFPQSDVVSPALLGALARSVHELIRFRAQYREESWAQFDAPWWTRRGPYLVARCEKSEYSAIFRRLLEKGILINPDYPGPSIVPAEYSDGELEPLRSLAREWRGGS